MKELLDMFTKQLSLFLFPIVGGFVGAAYSYIFGLEALDGYNTVISFSLFGAIWASAILVYRMIWDHK